MLALVYYGAEIASDSWRYKEVSWNSPARIQIYFFKTLIPIAGTMLIAQGISECMRCISALKTGEWPERMEDARETEDMIVQETEDLAAEPALHPELK
jgi:TRAP-type mannitol/chloroaromatic compound transport system permease small subunit